MSQEYHQEQIKVPRFEESKGFYTTKAKSAQMSKIRGKDTKPELLFRRSLYQNGVRYRVNVKSLPGRPDIANISRKFVVFIDGIFWHGYQWEEKKMKIKTNRGFWIPKIERNMQRDREVNLKLEKMGFKVFRFWEHEIIKNIDGCLDEVMGFIISK